ncbi:MAG: carbohydrate ABC transporter permease [Clostridia bacterium]|nr:carbohydrate ABC transporter permease [Clostridia bacterium]MBR5383476.1 carbohydrate ABC transporter permease [Clostridia bacterium]
MTAVTLTRRQRTVLGKAGSILLNIPFVLLIMTPLLYTFMMSVMPAEELYSRFWPTRMDFVSYLDVFTKTMIPRHILNSFIVAGTVTILQMITCSMAAFSFSFLNFRGRQFVFMCILATMMVPWEATIISNYLTVSKWGWLDTYHVLILPYGCGAMGVFLMRQNYLTFAKELHEAAKLDGCSNWRFLATIVIPLARPSLGALGAYVFLQQWNNYLWPLLVTNSDKVRTVQIGVAQMYDIDSESIALMMAAVIVTLVPSLSIFVFMQKNLINGLMAGAVKG